MAVAPVASRKYVSYILGKSEFVVRSHLTATLVQPLIFYQKMLVFFIASPRVFSIAVTNALHQEAPL